MHEVRVIHLIFPKQKAVGVEFLGRGWVVPTLFLWGGHVCVLNVPTSFGLWFSCVGLRFVWFSNVASVQEGCLFGITVYPEVLCGRGEWWDSWGVI